MRKSFAAKMNRAFSLNESGMTLAEIMVAVAILGIIFTIAPKIMMDTFKFFRMSIVRTELQRDARVSVDFINRKLRQAQASTVTVSRENSGQPPYSKVEFTTIQGSTMSFWQDGKTLFMQESGRNQRKMAENLRYLAFTYLETDDDDIMSVSTTFEGDVVAGQKKSLQMTVEKVRIMND